MESVGRDRDGEVDVPETLKEAQKPAHSRDTKSNLAAGTKVKAATLKWRRNPVFGLPHRLGVAEGYVDNVFEALTVVSPVEPAEVEVGADNGETNDILVAVDECLGRFRNPVATHAIDCIQFLLWRLYRSFQRWQAGLVGSFQDVLQRRLLPKEYSVGMVRLLDQVPRHARGEREAPKVHPARRIVIYAALRRDDQGLMVLSG